MLTGVAVTPVAVVPLRVELGEYELPGAPFRSSRPLLAQYRRPAPRLGAAVTPVNPALTVQEARYQIDDAGATLVVADDATAAALRHGPGRVIALEAVCDPPPYAALPPLVADPDALALLIYTSGTTGRPKGVMLDHANVGATARIIIDWFEMTGDTRSLLVLPLFHVNGIMVSVVSPLLAGGSAFVAERFHADSFWATVEKVRPSEAVCAPIA